MEQISITKFKATCLAVLDRVQITGTPIQVTRRGAAIAEVRPVDAAPTSQWLGCLAGTATTVGDIVSPATDAEDWDALAP